MNILCRNIILVHFHLLLLCHLLWEMQSSVLLLCSGVHCVINKFGIKPWVTDQNYVSSYIEHFVCPKATKVLAICLLCHL